MGKILSRNAVRIAAFIAIFLSSGVVFCGNDTIPSTPQTAEDWFVKGNNVIHFDRYEEAIVCYEKSIKLDPNGAYVYNMMGIAYLYGKENNEKAIECFEKAIELKPDFAEAYFQLGNAYADGRQDYDKAIECYAKAIKCLEEEGEFRLSFADVYSNLGNVYADGKQDYEKAIECYEKAIESNPYWSSPYYNLATVYGHLGDKDKELEYYKEAARLGDEEAQDLLHNRGVPWEEIDEP